MIELAQTLLPNLPEKLEWVYGVIYLFMTLIQVDLYMKMEE